MSRVGGPVAFDLRGIQRSMRGTKLSEKHERSAQTMRRRGPVASVSQPVRGRVTGSAVKSGAGLTTVWKYSFEQTVQSAPGAGNKSVLEGGVTGTLNAYNQWEEINPDAAGDTHPIGMGAFPDDLTDGATPTLGPVPDNTPALFYPTICTNGELIYEFVGLNTMTLECGEA